MRHLRPLALLLCLALLLASLPAAAESPPPPAPAETFWFPAPNTGFTLPRGAGWLHFDDMEDLSRVSFTLPSLPGLYVQVDVMQLLGAQARGGIPTAEEMQSYLALYNPITPEDVYEPLGLLLPGVPVLRLTQQLNGAPHDLLLAFQDDWFFSVCLHADAGAALTDAARSLQADILWELCTAAPRAFAASYTIEDPKLVLTPPGDFLLEPAVQSGATDSFPLYANASGPMQPLALLRATERPELNSKTVASMPEETLLALLRETSAEPVAEPLSVTFEKAGGAPVATYKTASGGTGMTVIWHGFVLSCCTQPRLGLDDAWLDTLLPAVLSSTMGKPTNWPAPLPGFAIRTHGNEHLIPLDDYTYMLASPPEDYTARVEDDALSITAPDGTVYSFSYPSLQTRIDFSDTATADATLYAIGRERAAALHANTGHEYRITTTADPTGGSNVRVESENGKNVHVLFAADHSALELSVENGTFDHPNDALNALFSLYTQIGSSIATESPMVRFVPSTGINPRPVSVTLGQRSAGAPTPLTREYQPAFAPFSVALPAEDAEVENVFVSPSNTEILLHSPGYFFEDMEVFTLQSTLMPQSMAAASEVRVAFLLSALESIFGIPDTVQLLEDFLPGTDILRLQTPGDYAPGEHLIAAQGDTLICVSRPSAYPGGKTSRLQEDILRSILTSATRNPSEYTLPTGATLQAPEDLRLRVAAETETETQLEILQSDPGFSPVAATLRITRRDDKAPVTPQTLTQQAFKRSGAKPKSVETTTAAGIPAVSFTADGETRHLLALPEGFTIEITTTYNEERLDPAYQDSLRAALLEMALGLDTPWPTPTRDFSIHSENGVFTIPTPGGSIIFDPGAISGTVYTAIHRWQDDATIAIYDMENELYFHLNAYAYDFPIGASPQEIEDSQAAIADAIAEWIRDERYRVFPLGEEIVYHKDGSPAYITTAALGTEGLGNSRPYIYYQIAHLNGAVVTLYAETGVDGIAPISNTIHDLVTQILRYSR